jgi:alpha-mannosidase
VRWRWKRADASVATTWVEADPHLSSGESLLRHAARGERPASPADDATHRGSYTTHRDVKSRNAALERALGEVEELVAWCAAVRAPTGVVRPLAEDLRNAWSLVLKNQSHYLLGGAATAEAYRDTHADYDRAERIVDRVRDGARSLLPRADIVMRAIPIAPVAVDGGFTFENAYVHARVRPDGTLVELRGVDGPNLVSVANGLMMYVDRPRAGDAWNLEASYERHPRRLRPGATRIVDDALEVELAGDGAAIVMRIALHAGEPYLRIELAVRWAATHRVLRAEHRFALRTTDARFGQPHGTFVHNGAPQTPAERARFEVPAQRFVHVTDGNDGVAIFAPDTYGWSAFALRGGGMRIGASLLRAPTWPDPTADRGDHTITYAIAPTAGATIGDLEAAWCDYAEPVRVRLFTCDDPAVVIVATKPADDGDGIIVRVRECNGETRRVDLICGGRMREAVPVDAGERTIAGEAVIEGERLSFMLSALALRSFRVRS